MSEPDVRRVASILHLALTLGVITFAVVAGVLHQSNPARYVTGGLEAVRLVSVGLAAAGFVPVIRLIWYRPSMLFEV